MSIYHESFPQGLFIPAEERNSPQFDQQLELSSVMLSLREQDILARLGGKEGTNLTQPFSLFMQEAAAAIVTEELGAEVALVDPRRDILQRFFRRILVVMDGAFDAQRENFVPAMAEGEDSFLAALNAVQITRAGEPYFTAGEAVHIFGKKIRDPMLYQPKAQALIDHSLSIFIDLGIKDMGRRDSADLTSLETQQVKEVTNGLYAQVLFNILYAPYGENPRYFHAQDRYVAAKLSFQYRDEVDDIYGDLAEGSANLVTAYAKKFGEINSLSALQQLPDADARSEDPLLFAQYCSLIQEAAPMTYRIVLTRQRELLQIASLPSETEDKIVLPELS